MKPRRLCCSIVERLGDLDLIDHYAIDDLKKKNIAVLYVNDEYGNGVHKVAEDLLQKRGMKLVAAEAFVLTHGAEMG